MGTTAQKLEYLGTTKSQLKDMINYGLDEENKITSSTTFRNYVSSIFNAFLEALRTPDTLFTNLPKKSGSGANITLNDTANAPMRIELGASELTQDGTPTPSSPQDIHTISGSNKVVVCGKNLFDKNSATDGKEISGTGIYNNASWCVSDYIPVKYGETYIKNKTGGDNYLTFDSNKTQLNTSTLSFSNSKITINDANIKFIRINLTIANKDTYQLELGTSSTTYEPYISQEAEVDLSSKNLLSPNFSDYSIATGNYGYFKLPDQSMILSLTDKDTSVDISGVYFGWTVAGTSGGSGTGWAVDNGTIKNHSITNLKNNANMVYISFYPKNETTFNKIFSRFNVMVSTNATNYEPYYNIEYCKIGNYEDKFIRTTGKNLIDAVYYNANNYVSQKLTLKAGTYITSYTGDNSSAIYIRKADGTTPINGTSVAEGYNRTSFSFTLTNDGDYYIQFYLGGGGFTNFRNAILNTGQTALPYEPYGSNEWYIKKNIGKVVLDGNTILNYNGTAGMFYSANQTQIPNYKASTPLLSNYLQYSSTTWVKNCFGITSANVFWLYIENGPTSLADLQTWLSTHNLDIRYVLNTPTYTQITGTLANQLENVYQKLLSYSGTTNISQINNDLGFVMSVSAIEE